MDKRPIGVFDSGLGGISTLIQARYALRHEQFIYFGDCGNAPYGNRCEADIQELTLRGCRQLMEHDVKAIVLACNTATAAALALVRENLPVPVIGIAPAILEASAQPGDGIVLMMATEATVRLPQYARLRERLPNPDRVKDIPCPADIVRRIERCVFDIGYYDDLLREVLFPYESSAVDSIVLGCTHYAFIRPEIERYARTHFQSMPCFFEGGKATVDALRATLLEQGLDNHAGNASVEFYTSDASMSMQSMQKIFQRLLRQTHLSRDSMNAKAE